MVIAHRTCPRDAPENSRAGIRKAAELGADAVEIDVRLTADDQPVLMHDRWLFRTTGRRARVDRVPIDEVTGLTLRRSDETVPTLAEALAELAPLDPLRMAIDVKDPAAADAVIAEVRNQHLAGRVMFWAQSPDAVRHARLTAPGLEVSLLRDAKRPAALRRFLDDAHDTRAHGISAHWSVIRTGFVQQVFARGLRLYAWCKINNIDPGKASVLHGLVTDWPRLGREAVDA